MYHKGSTIEVHQCECLLLVASWLAVYCKEGSNDFEYEKGEKTRSSILN